MVDLRWEDMDAGTLAGLVSDQTKNLLTCHPLSGPEAEDMEDLMFACQDFLETKEIYDHTIAEQAKHYTDRRYCMQDSLKCHRQRPL